MTRRTYYLPKATAEALDQAVDVVLAATGGRTAKHEALAAILAAGIGQADTVAAGLKAAMLRELQ